MMNDNKHSGFRRLLVVCVALLTCAAFAGCGDDADTYEEGWEKCTSDEVHVGVLSHDVIKVIPAPNVYPVEYICVNLDRKGHKDGDVVQFIIREKRPYEKITIAEIVCWYAKVDIID